MGSILLVEADPDTCDRWASELVRAGHDAVASRSVREALPVIREGGIDLVIVDGYDSCAGVLDLARSLEALPDAPPIVLVSSSPAAPEISVRIGVAQFIAKPCDASEIVAAADADRVAEASPFPRRRGRRGADLAAPPVRLNHSTTNSRTPRAAIVRVTRPSWTATRSSCEPCAQVLGARIGQQARGDQLWRVADDEHELRHAAVGVGERANVVGALDVPVTRAARPRGREILGEAGMSSSEPAWSLPTRLGSGIGERLIELVARRRARTDHRRLCASCSASARSRCEQRRDRRDRASAR